MVHGGEGDNAVLSCTVHGHPTPTVSWMRDHRLIPSSNHFVGHDAAHRYTLTLENVSEPDFGEYTCDASNNLGSEQGKIRLTG